MKVLSWNVENLAKYVEAPERPSEADAARVDFALVSRTLLPRVIEADIDERVEARLASDHAPLWVTLRA